jgi:hypothetical protein
VALLSPFASSRISDVTKTTTNPPGEARSPPVDAAAPRPVAATVHLPWPTVYPAIPNRHPDSPDFVGALVLGGDDRGGVAVT